MNLFQRLFAALLLLTTCMSGLAQEETQQEPIDILLERLDRHQRLQPQEKLYLHVEKEVHDQGEHLWFKIYLVAGARHRPSPISTGAYVELLGPDGSKLKKKYIKVNRGLGYGDIEITADMPKGRYRLKAYTDWMKNFDWDYIPESPVLIKASAEEETTKSNDCDVSFYPEGGKWVAGLRQKVAFASGDYSSASGTIVNKAGDEVQSFDTGDDKIGLMEMEVEEGAELFAQISGCDAKVPMPAIAKTGTVMTARNMGNRFIRLDIQTNQEEDGSLLHAIIQSRGVVTNRVSIQINGTRARAIVPMGDLESGISQITLFNEQLALLSERLIFVPETDELKLEANTNATKRAQWSQVDLSLKNADDVPLSGHYSVALFGEEPKPVQSIAAYLNLAAELPSAPFDLEEYMGSENESVQALDRLLITQKWNWITWKNLIMNRLTDTDKSLNTYMNDAYLERQKFKADEEAIADLDANARRLDDVVVTAKREEVQENITVPNIYGKGDAGTVDFDDIQVNNNETILDAIRGRIAGVVVSGVGPMTTVNIRTSVTGTGDSYVPLEPLILLNNIPTDISSILDIPVRFVKTIEIFKGSQASIFGLRGAGGAISIYTRNEPVVNPGAGPESEEETGVGEAEAPKAYEKPNLFEARPSANPKGLIYWNPLLTTDDKGNISFEFKKPEDFEGPVYMHIQGIGRDGTSYSVVKKLD